MQMADSGGPERRTVLAGDRTVYAAERTCAAWVRTGLAALASGIGAKGVLAGVVPEFLIIGTGTILVLFSACFAVAVMGKFKQGAPPPEPDIRRIPVRMSLGFNGFLVPVSLPALLGVRFGKTGG